MLLVSFSGVHWSTTPQPNPKILQHTIWPRKKVMARPYILVEHAMLSARNYLATCKVPNLLPATKSPSVLECQRFTTSMKREGNSTQACRTAQKDSRGLDSAHGSSTNPMVTEKSYRLSICGSGKDELGVMPPLTEALLALEQR
jgi:hypothetical protein